MSIYNPTTLQELAVQSLLWNEASTISTLEYLPINLFPSVFKEAFTGRHMELLKAMVAAWPFSYLPVGTLMKTPDVELLQAVLDGVDILQTQQVRPRCWRLKVLDLRNMNKDFWDVWSCRDWYSSTETECNTQVCNELRRDLKVVTDLILRFHLKEHQTCLLQWFQQRKDSVQLCCVKMKICDFPGETLKEVLDIFLPENIEELELSTNQVMSFLGHIAPHLGRMTRLRKCRLTHIFVNRNTVVNTLADPEEMCAVQFLSQICKLNSLKHLTMDVVSLSPDHTQLLFGHELISFSLLRCLKTPLESLNISHCHLSQSNLKHFSQCQGLCQLNKLNLTGVVFARLGVTHLRVLLENTADTLKTLELVNCRMEDYELSALLPALSLCSQLTTVNFYDNDFSTAVLKKLLQSMANLRKMTEEFYPAPLECYDPMGFVLVEEFAQLCSEFLDILFAKRQTKTIAFATIICLECSMRCVYDMEAKLCQCWQ
ncbi:PRAME family member 6-like [Mesocricetus auratus]|uniref:PRAME family member 6-like n=1 Tax=Mesocricetus auratus TaxID=10036 RepID=A0ABM2X1K5_MESAU|nr:PRAME family member 6-like [Mesocricetus auratus]